MLEGYLTNYEQVYIDLCKKIKVLVNNLANWYQFTKLAKFLSFIVSLYMHSLGIIIMYVVHGYINFNNMLWW